MALARASLVARFVARRPSIASRSLVASRELLWSRQAPQPAILCRRLADSTAREDAKDAKNAKDDTDRVGEEQANAEDKAKADASADDTADEGTKASAEDGGEPSKEEQPAEEEPPLSPGMALKREVAALREEVTSTKNKLLLALADFENNKRALKKERDSRHRYAYSRFATKMVGVYKKFDGAFPDGKLAEGGEGPLHSLNEGIVLTRQAFNATMGRFDVQRLPFEPGSALVPAKHERVGTVEGDGTFKPETLGQEVEAGWVLNLKGQKEMVLEKARVKVFAAGPATQTPPSS